MTYEESLEYIHNNSWKGVAPGLNRIRELLNYMGNPQDELKFIHVAGTNGKGSVCSMVSSVLREAGYKTGLFTSPHIYEFTERMQVDGQQIQRDELCGLLEYVKTHIEKMQEKPTEFEIISAMGFEYFKRKKCDIVVLEVGLGGLMDSTNIIKNPEVCVITAIGLDHTGLLGTTLEEIATEKSGIIKTGADVVVYNQTPTINQIFANKSLELGVQMDYSQPDEVKLISKSLDYLEFDYKEYKNIRVNLTGIYQLKNAAVALKVVEKLKLRGYNITDAAVRAGMEKTKWPSRFEVFMKSPVFIVDGAHNPQGIVATANSLKTHFPGEKIVFIIGVMDDKDLDSMIPSIADIAKEYIAVTPDYAGRALDGNKLGEYLKKYNALVTVCDTVGDGVKMALEKVGKTGIVCAIGSLYMPAEVRECLKEYIVEV